MILKINRIQIIWLFIISLIIINTVFLIPSVYTGYFRSISDGFTKNCRGISYSDAQIKNLAYNGQKIPENFIIEPINISFLYVNFSSFPMISKPSDLFTYNITETIKVGNYNKLPVNSVVFKDIVGYLWNMQNSHDSGSKIFDYLIIEDQNNHAINFLLLEIDTVGGDWNLFDHIFLTLSNYSVNTETGTILLIREGVANIEGNFHPMGILNVHPDDVILIQFLLASNIIAFIVLLGTFIYAIRFSHEKKIMNLK